MRFRRVGLALAILIASCAPLPPSGPAPTATEVEARRAVLRALDRWDVRGRVAVRLPDQGAQASLRWRHQNNREEIDLVGPFGGGHARLQYDASGARLRDARGREYEGADPEALLYQATGWHVPLAGLAYWIRGLPFPDAASAQELDDRGRLRALKQLGWDVEFLGYEQVHGYELPNKIFLLRRLPGHVGVADDPRIEVRVVVSSWDLARPQ